MGTLLSYYARAFRRSFGRLAKCPQFTQHSKTRGEAHQNIVGARRSGAQEGDGHYGDVVDGLEGSSHRGQHDQGRGQTADCSRVIPQKILGLYRRKHQEGAAGALLLVGGVLVRARFETMLRAEIVLPSEAIRPGEPYLAWHQQRIYKGDSDRQLA